MAFRWPSVKDDIALATEVARERPEKPSEWDKIAELLSELFSNDEKKVSLKGRGCRERMDRILKKVQNAKSLKRSGSEEEYSELEQLCEDIITYRQDLAEMKEKEKEAQKRKDENDRKRQKK